MDIVFHGLHTVDAAASCLLSVLRLLKESYQIGYLHEMQLTLSLVDAKGFDVELVDSESGQPYRIVEVFSKEAKCAGRPTRTALQLVVDNTKFHK